MTKELNVGLVPGLRQEANASPRAKNVFSLGPGLDGLVGGGLERAALHEVVAAPGESVPAIAFALAIALCAASQPPPQLTSPVSTPATLLPPTTPRQPAAGGWLPLLWVRERAAAAETGPAYAPGLVDLGLDPHRLTLVTLGRALDALRATLEAARCPAVGAVVLETMDTGRTIDLTATRRLTLAAESSGATVVIVRVSGPPGANAARTRWRAAAAASRTLTGFSSLAPGGGGLGRGGAQDPREEAPDRHVTRERAVRLGPGRPCFDVTLLKRRAGIAGLDREVEWNRDRRIFEEALPLSLAALPGRRRLAA